jgi:amino acid transporter
VSDTNKAASPPRPPVAAGAPNAPAPEAKLERGLGLTQATALNMIDMIGIGPFIVAADVVKDMAGPQALLAWLAGAVLSMIDGCIWAEQGAAMPQAGGSYIFLREAYGPRWGRLMSFLFIWQTLFQAPLVMASASIGFASYFQYIVPLAGASAFGQYEANAVSGWLVVLLVFLLYRRITTIGKISVAIWVGVLGTMAWLIWGGLTHFNADLVLDYPAGAWDLNWVFWAGLGAASVRTMYSYLGYYNVCHLGGEIRDPERNIPRAIFISIAGIAVLYLLMQTSILAVVPWREAAQSKFLASTFVERLYGTGAAKFATAMILWIAVGSLFSLTLGYSRIPYAAAADGRFFSIFARVHPTKHFPHVSLLFLGALGFTFSLFFKLSEVIAAILAMRILVQFVGGAVGVMVLRRRWAAEGRELPYRMPLFPLPALVAIAGWLAILFSTGAIEVRGVRVHYWLAGLLMTALGALVFLARARMQREWPFATAAADQRG